MDWSRRNVVKLLSGIPATGVIPFFSRGWRPQRTLPAGLPVLSSGLVPCSAGKRLGPAYKDLGYKLFIVDFQFSDLEPETMKYADAEKLAEAMVEMGVDSLLVYAITNAGLALFKSQYAPKYKNLPDNFLGDYLEACRKRNIKTVLYYSLCWQRILDVDHPDWAILDANSKPVQIDTTDSGFLGKVNYLCLNSPFFDLASKQVKEIADRYTFDSWFVDILFWNHSFICYNPYCLAKWKARTGMDLPRPFPDELYPQYLDFMAEVYRSTLKAIKDQLKASGRDVPITHNDGFDYTYDDYVFSESNPRGADFYETGINAKFHRAVAQGREVQMDPHLNNDYLDYVNAPLEKLRWQIAMILSHNAAVMWGQQANVDGTLNQATIRLTKEALKVADRLIPKVRGTVPYAEVAILANERGQLLSNYRDYPDYYAANKLLQDLHWPYDVVSAGLLKSSELASYSLFVVPSVEYLSAEDRQTVLEYLENGGHLFFCGHCAVFDQNGKRHATPNFGLVEIDQETHAPRGYIKTSFPIDDERLKAAQVVTVKPDSTHKVLGRWIHLSATRREGFPLEDVAYPLETTDVPVIVTGRKGKGQFTYAGYSFFDEYRKQGLPLLAEVFCQLVKDSYQPAVWVEAPTVVDAIYNQFGSELRISLVNGTTGRPSGGDYEDAGTGRARGYVNIVEPIPIANIRIRLRDKRVRQATNLAGEKLPVTMEHGTTVITVPHLERYDLISLELA